MDADEWVEKGNVLCNIGNYQEALDAYDLAISHDIENASVWNNKAFALYHLGRYQEALDACDTALLIDQNYVMAWENKGNVFDKLAKYEEAIGCYDRALKINPNNKEILTSKERTQWALKTSKSSPQPLTPHDNEKLHIPAKLQRGSKFYGGDSPQQSDAHVLSSIKKIDTKIKNGSAQEIVANGKIPFIIKCARHRHKEIRKNANWALGNLALYGKAEQVLDAGAVPILIEALSDESGRTRSSSAWALSALAEKGHAQTLVKLGAIQPLITGLKSSNNLVRGCSARALDKIAFAGFADDLDLSNTIPCLIQNLGDGYDNVRKTSLWALWSIAVKGPKGRFGEDTVLKHFIRYTLDKDIEIRSGTLHLLGVLGKKGLSERLMVAGITSPLIKSLSSRSRRVRGSAAWALGEIDQNMAGDEFIRAGAIAELKKISGDNNKIFVFNESSFSWSEKPIREIVEKTLCVLERKELQEAPVTEELPRPSTLVDKITKIITTNPKDRKLQEKLVKIKQRLIEVTKKINWIEEHEIKKINNEIQSTYDKAIKSRIDQEVIFLAKRIKYRQLILNSKWETLDRLLKIQHYYEQMLVMGDQRVSLKDFGLQEFSEKEIEDFVIGTKLDRIERDKKVEFIEVITSPAINPDVSEEGLNDILDEIRQKKEVIHEK